MQISTLDESRGCFGPAIIVLGRESEWSVGKVMTRLLLLPLMLRCRAERDGRSCVTVPLQQFQSFFRGHACG